MGTIALTSHYNSRNELTTYSRNVILDRGLHRVLWLLYRNTSFLHPQYAHRWKNPPTKPKQVGSTAVITYALCRALCFLEISRVRVAVFLVALWHPCRNTRLLTDSTPNLFRFMLTFPFPAEKTRSERLCVLRGVRGVWVRTEGAPRQLK